MNAKSNDWLRRFQDSTWLYSLSLVVVYLLWKVLHHYLRLPSFPLYAPWKTLVQVVGTWYAAAATPLLCMLGEQVTHVGITFQFHPSLRSVLVEEHCLAFPGMFIFTWAILLYKGAWKNKLWFIPLGLLGIVCINIIRLVFLGLTFEHFGALFFSINHSLIYVVVTYSLIFLMIYWWMEKLAQR